MLSAAVLLEAVLLEAALPAAGLDDEVPGVGRIKAIYQRGASWVVQTNNGLIQ